MTLKLYCFGESGNAYKAALPLELSGLEWEPIFVDFFNGEARSPDYIENVNGMAEVPVLIDGDIKLSQSGLIQIYIAEKSGKFGGEDADEKREVLRWILWDSSKLSGQIGMTRFLMNFLDPEKRPHEVIKFHQARLKVSYNVLNTHLTQRDWIVGRSVTNADFSCCSYLFYQEPFGFDRKDWPAIESWMDRIAALPGWKHPYDLMEPAFPRKK
ncbi:MAG: glutathione S-transferase family protein [Silicimonas sp.]|nr:glutathione S-transferase family protein [Silicimonas sp.]